MSQTIYFTADLHLGHKGILSFGQRKHDTIADMYAAMIEAWNNTVRKEKDIVWILGDVCMDMEAMKYIHAFRGEKRLILGNHDKFDYPVYTKYFSRVYHFQKRYHGIILTHIPIHPCELQYNWKYNIHGHIHHKEKDIDDPRYLNVNVDVAGYAPISLEEARSKLY